MKGVTVRFRERIDARSRRGVRRRLSFFASGAGGPDDASERVDEYVGGAVRRAIATCSRSLRTDRSSRQ